MTTSEQVLIPVLLPPNTDPLRLAVAAYLARFKGQSRIHTESDLRAFVTWCDERGLDPLAAQRPHVELYVCWMHEVRRFKPSTGPSSKRIARTAASPYIRGFATGTMPHADRPPGGPADCRRPGWGSTGGPGSAQEGRSSRGCDLQ